MIIPNNRRTVNRLLAHVPPKMVCFCREGLRKWQSEFSNFAIRERPALVNELWEGDHHVFDVFVRITAGAFKNDQAYRKEVAVRPTLTAWMDVATGCIVGWVISVLPNQDTIAEAFCRAVTLTAGEEFHGLPRAVLIDNGKDYRSKLMEDCPDSLLVSVGKMDGSLNRRFAGMGILPALGVDVFHAAPYAPQTKSHTERVFGAMERIWICKLPGWCHSSVAERPDGFARKLDKLLEDRKLLTLEEFVRYFQSVILPGYHHLKEDPQNEKQMADSGWFPDIESMSPLERYHSLEKPFLVTPGWETLCALKCHNAPGRKIQKSGIKSPPKSCAS